MDRETVRAQLAQIHEELARAHEAHPETREHLDALLPAVKQASEGGEHDEGLPQRLEAVAVQFEAKHPTLAGSMRRLVDLLGEVGI